jgi:hypothetical protein
MSSYLFTFRAPAGFTPSAASFDVWAAWQRDLGARLKDRGNPAFASAALARGCPLLRQGGAVEICELANHDDRFDGWLDTIEEAR